MKRHLLILLILLATATAMAQKHVSDLVVSPAFGGGTIKWYTASTGGTQYTTPTTTALVDGTTYYASQTVNGVESTTRLAVTATVNSRPIPTFTVQPGATANINTDVTYTTQNGMSGYVWTFPGTLTTDYTISLGGTSTDHTVTLKYVTNGSKTVSINYTANGCTAASATLSTPTTISMLPPGNAMAFDGSNDFVDVGNGASVQLTQGTLEAWIKTSGSGTNSNIITKQWAYGLFLNNNVLKIYEWGGAGFITTGINLADSRWHHVAFSFNSGVTNGSFVYVDGELKLTTTYTVNNQGVSLGIGALTAGGELFTGTMDEVRVWNTMRSLAEIQSTLYTEMAGTENGLLLNYNFNQGVAGGNNTGITTLFDKTSNTNNGTLRNFSNTGSTSNFVESYAMAVPVPAAATSITSTGFTANWAAPVTGTVSSYKLDVSTSSTFSSFVTGYNGLDCGTSLSQAVSGLTAGTTYYYRVRADKTSLTGSGGYYRTPVTVTTTMVFAIGDTYQGGKVAYLFVSGDPGYVSGETHGLIAASSDNASTTWGRCGTATTATGIVLGTGNQNTLNIQSTDNTAGIAARLCTALRDGGYSDWYLPSKDELYKLYLNRVAIGNFDLIINGYYWSSTQSVDVNNWNAERCQFKNNGVFDGPYKESVLRSRAVRSF